MGQELVIQCTDNIIASDCDSIYGTPMKPYLLKWHSEANLSEVLARATTGSYSGIDKFVDFAIAAAHAAWDLIALVSGVYVFTILYYIGMPSIMVLGIAFIYLILLLRSVFGWIRGI